MEPEASIVSHERVLGPMGGGGGWRSEGGILFVHPVEPLILMADEL